MAAAREPGLVLVWEPGSGLALELAWAPVRALGQELEPALAEALLLALGALAVPPPDDSQQQATSSIRTGL